MLYCSFAVLVEQLLCNNISAVKILCLKEWENYKNYL